MTATHGVEANNGESIRDLVESLVQSQNSVDGRGEDFPGLLDATAEAVGVTGFESSIRNIESGTQVVSDSAHDSSPSFVAGKPNVAGTPGRESEHSASRTTNERLPGS